MILKKKHVYIFKSIFFKLIGVGLLIVLQTKLSLREKMINQDRIQE